MKFKHIILPIFLVALTANSCKDLVDDINVDPNNAADAPIGTILNAAFTGMITAHSGEDARHACMFTRQFAGSDRQYAGFEVYAMTSANFEWDKFYIVAENAKIVIQKATATNNKLASGIAKILQAHSLGTVCSLWGDIPFTEANKFPEIANPVFDPQDQVYADLQTLLDEAINDLKGSPSSAEIEATDFYFGGDSDKWLAVANSLKARYYLHVRNYAAAIDAAGKGVLSTDGDWKIPFTNGGYNADMNTYHSFGQFDRQGYLTANGAILPGLLDPASAAYRGNAKTDEEARFDFVYTGTGPAYDLNYEGMWAATADFPLVTAVETHLIMAEALWRANNDTNGALTHLNHVRDILAAQFSAGKYDAYTLADFDPNGIAGRAGETAAQALLHEIMEEKYASMVGQIETFNDLRRTDNLLKIPPTTGTSIPERYLIPQVEIDANTNTPNPIPGLFDPTPVNR